MPNDAPNAPATIEEVFTMVSAGLAGVAPHMVSASIAALSRLLFEFHDRLSTVVVEDLVATVMVFLQSNNREIVRSVLGFVKVTVVVLPEKTMRPRMPELVPGLMVWSKENKGRLRAKVKGILERCMRKFGAAELEKWVGEGDRKMIINIRKRKERSKRKKVGGDDEDSMEGGDNRKFDNELDEVLGSDDDSEISFDDDDGQPDRINGSSKSRSKAQFIRDEDDDEPLDLLGPNALANVSTKKFVRFKDGEATKRKTKAKTNEDGKLVFGDKDDSDDGDALMTGVAEGESAVNAYMDAVDGPDAIRRGQKGRLKVSSGNQKKTRMAPAGEKMDLDVDEARQVARSILKGRDSPRGRGFDHGKRSKLPERRGLGIEKSKDKGHGSSPGGRIEKRGHSGVGRRGGFRAGRGTRRR